MKTSFKVLFTEDHFSISTCALFKFRFSGINQYKHFFSMKNEQPYFIILSLQYADITIFGNKFIGNILIMIHFICLIVKSLFIYSHFNFETLF